MSRDLTTGLLLIKTRKRKHVRKEHGKNPKNRSTSILRKP